MILTSPDSELRTQAYGGVVSSPKGAIPGGESLLLSTFVVKREGEIWLAPELPGDMAAVELDGGSDLIVRDTSYLARSGDIDIDAVFTVVEIVAEGQLFRLKLSGRGTVWLGSYGAVEVREPEVNEGVTIDNFHLAAADWGVSWNARLFSGLK